MTNRPQMYDAIIVGGGACGLMCAAQAGLLGKSTLLLERNDRLGAKILISGGGRCNFTNLHTTSDNFVSENPDFAKPIFEKWTVQDTIDFFESYGIVGKEKTLGQLFPVSNKAKDVVEVFANIMRKTQQKVRLGALVTNINKSSNGFEVHVNMDEESVVFKAHKVVLASGGLPVAKLGASDFALRTAGDMGLKIVPTAPALVPLVITGKDADWYKALSGNTVMVRVSNHRIAFEEQVLFTHWGLSGPAILQISSYWRPGERIYLDLLPGIDLAKLIKDERNAGGKRKVAQLLQAYFSKRLLEALGQVLPLDIKVASLSKTDANLITAHLHKFEVKPATDKGYDKAEVMRGGVSTEELDPETLMAKKIPGLYMGGEAVDMTGWLGGYNFQWAWASGYLIAKAI
ncbi:MAG TPA: aminoacetone oxidase family FAD-binding enzyme [Sphingobacteriaceae bacterium]|nr:aminoacetone oxidase family FAD-binding enzyme [Sphingobacteriaceae bacterium]